MNSSQPLSNSLALPAHLFGAQRLNSRGIDVADPTRMREIAARIAAYRNERYQAGPLLGPAAQVARTAPTHEIRAPAHLDDVVGVIRDATPDQIRSAFTLARQAFPAWSAAPVDARAQALERAAAALESKPERFLALLVREAGKTVPDAIAEIRETIDFCRYYSVRARELLAAPAPLPGPTGERNSLSLHARGVFACISPWNFPLAIFAGQISAALVAGNTVVAKPAPETPLVAHAFTQLLHEAGIPRPVLQLAPAGGAEFGAVAFDHPALAGVAFTGSTRTAQTINRALASRDGAILPLIAETGGINAMIVDSSALTEQVVDDVITSAYGSAGQRCSALRVLYLQEEIAQRTIDVLKGAMQAMAIGDPADLDTDVGPVISARARDALESHAARMEREATLLYACPLGECSSRGHYVAPRLFELRSLDQLDVESFGPLLHVARYRADQLTKVFDAIRATGYALTLGVHSRRRTFSEEVFRNTDAGNTYVNRNMIGAVVGAQPFGGSSLSGTGPKAGGPHYLSRFLTERTLTINTAAIGGDVELVA
jgi:RHH-type transcriptional regulator, proline utilization regulon repressor / proline dehydrogenase / delta 1-pyrroline-5-carboxylate dehydrogenase